MKLELTERRFCIFGLQGSGKTVFGRWLAKQTARPFIVDPLNEYGDIEANNPNATIYIPTFRTYGPEAIDEINRVVEYMLTLEPAPTLFLIDEANRWCPNKKPLPEQIGLLNDESRHHNIALGFIARRPVQLNTDLAELAHYLVVFSLAGKNDRSYLNDIADTFGDQVCAQTWHDSIIADYQRRLQKCPAIPLT